MLDAPPLEKIALADRRNLLAHIPPPPRAERELWGQFRLIGWRTRIERYEQTNQPI